MEWRNNAKPTEMDLKRETCIPVLSGLFLSAERVRFNLIKLQLDKKFPLKLKCGISYREICRIPKFYPLKIQKPALPGS